MKEITLEQLARETATLVDAAQSERVVIIKNGIPAAVLVGIENKDDEDWQLQLSPEFWRMIEARRQEPTVRLEDIKEELLRDDGDGSRNSPGCPEALGCESGGQHGVNRICPRRFAN